MGTYCARTIARCMYATQCAHQVDIMDSPPVLLRHDATNTLHRPHQPSERLRVLRRCSCTDQLADILEERSTDHTGYHPHSIAQVCARTMAGMDGYTDRRSNDYNCHMFHDMDEKSLAN